jgi:hypothetical protein
VLATMREVRGAENLVFVKFEAERPRIFLRSRLHTLILSRFESFQIKATVIFNRIRLVNRF